MCICSRKVGRTLQHKSTAFFNNSLFNYYDDINEVKEDIKREENIRKRTNLAKANRRLLIDIEAEEIFDELNCVRAFKTMTDSLTKLSKLLGKALIGDIKGELFLMLFDEDGKFPPNKVLTKKQKLRMN